MYDAQYSLRDYFGPLFQLIFITILPNCPKAYVPTLHLHFSFDCGRNFWKLTSKFPLDDGGGVPSAPSSMSERQISNVSGPKDYRDLDVDNVKDGSVVLFNRRGSAKIVLMED